MGSVSECGSTDRLDQSLVTEEPLMTNYCVSQRTFKHHKRITFVFGCLCQISSIAEAIRCYTNDSSSSSPNSCSVEDLYECDIFLEFRFIIHILSAVLCIFLLYGIWQHQLLSVGVWIACDLTMTVTLTGFDFWKGTGGRESVISFSRCLVHLFTAAMAVDFCGDIKMLRRARLAVVQTPEVNAEPVILHYAPDNEDF